MSITSDFATVRDYDLAAREAMDDDWGSAPVFRRQYLPFMPDRPVSTYAIATSGGRDRLSVRMPDGSFHRLTVAHIADALATPFSEMIRLDLEEPPKAVDYQPIMLVERADVSKVRQMLLDASEHRVLRQFDAAVKIHFSARVPVLTDLLREMLWAPAEVETFRIREWMDGLGLDQSSQGYLDALDIITDERATTDPARDRSRKEPYLLGSMYAGGVGSMNSAYRFLSAIEANDRAAAGLDPLLYERSTVGGTANALTLVRSDKDGVQFTASAPFKLKPGRHVLVSTTAHTSASQVPRTYHANIAEVAVMADESIRVTLTSGVSALAAISSVAVPVMVEKPFTGGFGRSTRTGRWLDPKGQTPEERVVHRDVPAHIVLAGQPD